MDGDPKASPSVLGEEIMQMFQRQRNFQRMVFPNWDTMSPADVAATTRDLVMHLISESEEVLRETQWKIHRKLPGMVMVRSNIHEELVDVFKFWLALYQLHGFTLEDLPEEFARKSTVVEQRWMQEQSLKLDPKRTVVVDVDATLCDYVGGFLDYVAAHYQVPPIDRSKIEGSDLSGGCAKYLKQPVADLVALKHRYRDCGGKLLLDPLPDAAAMLRSIQFSGGQIAILTARPYETYKRVFADTLVWLQKHSMPYDAIWMSEDKREFLLRVLPTCVAVVDDDATQALRLAEAGYLVMVPQWPSNAGLKHERIRRGTLEQIGKWLTSELLLA